MTMQKRLMTALGVLVAAGLIAPFAYFRGSWTCTDGTWTKTGRPYGQHPATECRKVAVAPKACDPAWSCGKLTRGEAGMKPGSWYLKYDDVSGAQKLEITFADDAACSVDGAVAECGSLNPPSGSGSSFSGAKDGETFKVSRLEFRTK